MIDPKAQQKLNNYLTAIEEALKGIGVADRSDILLELNSHIKESLEQGDQNIDKIFAALGLPEQVANRYLLDRGLQPIPLVKFPWIKTLSLSAVAAFSLAVIAFIMIIQSFSPILSINEEDGRVIILGGLIDVNEKEGNVSFGNGSIVIEDKNGNGRFDFQDVSEKFAGEIDSKDIKKLYIRGQNGKFLIIPSPTQILDYKCEIGGLGTQNNVSEIIDISTKGRIDFNLSSNILAASKCEFSVPENIEINVDVGNAKVKLEDLRQNVFVRVGNGKIIFEKDKRVSYVFTTQLNRGKISGLKTEDYNNSDPHAYKIELKATNGKISIE